MRKKTKRKSGLPFFVVVVVVAGFSFPFLRIVAFTIREVGRRRSTFEKEKSTTRAEEGCSVRRGIKKNKTPTRKKKENPKFFFLVYIYQYAHRRDSKMPGAGLNLGSIRYLNLFVYACVCVCMCGLRWSELQNSRRKFDHEAAPKWRQKQHQLNKAVKNQKQVCVFDGFRKIFPRRFTVIRKENLGERERERQREVGDDEGAQDGMPHRRNRSFSNASCRQTHQS